jgi:hypothetical protein
LLQDQGLLVLGQLQENVELLRHKPLPAATTKMPPLSHTWVLMASRSSTKKPSSAGNGRLTTQLLLLTQWELVLTA